ncbi:hypothetical protein HHI36_003139 [Cryptolaemus montrouzieri]|uniref:Uncharacterized protein n=1 Tax=Cryptolaemus montrouzieri TaxID=559131 RepID=A0ABD2PCP2_9CUCU
MQTEQNLHCKFATQKMAACITEKGSHDTVRPIYEKINGDPEELIAEINERNSKVNNVTVYKLNESNSQILNERILHDKAEVVKFLDMIDIKEDVIEKVICVGKKGTKPRPMKIVLSNSRIARTVLRNK